MVILADFWLGNDQNGKIARDAGGEQGARIDRE